MQQSKHRAPLASPKHGEGEFQRAPARNTNPTLKHAFNNTSSATINHMLQPSIRPTTATRAVHTLRSAAKSFSSQMSSATLDLGAESQLSDKKAVRKQLHSLLSSLPSDHVQRQCPSFRSCAMSTIVKLTFCKPSMLQICSCPCPSIKMLVQSASSCPCPLAR
jgi:hypothetical protein